MLDARNKSEIGILALFPLLMSTVRCLAALPREYRKNNNQNMLSWYPLHRQLLAGRGVSKQGLKLYEQAKKFLPGRYSDSAEDQEGLPPFAAGVALLPTAARL